MYTSDQANVCFERRPLPPIGGYVSLGLRRGNIPGHRSTSFFWIVEKSILLHSAQILLGRHIAQGALKLMAAGRKVSIVLV